MQTFQFSVEPNEINHFFCCLQFKHKEIFYRVAVADTIMYDGDFTGGYSVLSVSERGTVNFNLCKDQEDNWAADNFFIPQELAYLIGTEIDKEQAKNKQGFERLKGGL